MVLPLRGTTLLHPVWGLHTERRLIATLVSHAAASSSPPSPSSLEQELQLQDKMLTDLDAKTDKTQGKLDKINDRCAVVRGVRVVCAAGVGIARGRAGVGLTVTPRTLPACRMKDTLAKLNEKSTNVCMYLICLILLLGIGTVAYSQAKKVRWGLGVCGRRGGRHSLPSVPPRRVAPSS